LAFKTFPELTGPVFQGFFSAYEFFILKICRTGRRAAANVLADGASKRHDNFLAHLLISGLGIGGAAAPFISVKNYFIPGPAGRH
jgi:hypothetical protein